MLKEELINDFISLSLREDIGDGDHTSLACIPPEAVGKAQLLIKDNGVLAGVEIAKMVFKRLDEHVRIETLIGDGNTVSPGDISFYVSGKVLALLQAERLVLNIMQRMSGIATQTRQYVEAIKGLDTKVLDTRKTTPGMRMLDKHAVRMGGGVNHRIGLFDMILIKDNHIDFAGGITNAINRAKSYLDSKSSDLKIEVEVRNLKDIKEALDVGGVDRILIDNFSVDETKKALALIGGKVETESSGGISLDNIRDYAECGVDYISVGALTHQVKSLDLSLKAIDY